MARQSKRQKLYDDWNDRQHWLRQNSPVVGDVLPGVKAVRINLTFEYPDKHGGGEPSPKQLRFGAAQRAYFHIPCPDSECVRGGFDLDAAVRDAVRRRTASVSGENICEGWQDPERIGRHRCWLKVRYEIQIEYGGTTTSTASTLALAPA